MLHINNWLHPVHCLSTLTVVVALTGACVIAPKESGSESSGGDIGTGTGTGGTNGQSDTSASDTTAAADPSSPFETTGIDAGGDDGPSMSTSGWVPGEETTGVFTTTATTDAESETENLVFDMPCGGGTVEQFDQAEWLDAIAKYDDDALAQAVCASPPEPSELPVPGLAQALVIRNDALPQPWDFVTGNTRWMLWSNVEIGCTDPFAAQLCDGQWRVSVALPMPNWCELRIEETGTGGIGFSPGSEYPFWMDVGDANCATTRFVIGNDEGHVNLQFQGMGDKLPGDPQPGEMRVECAVPGVDSTLTGTFVAEICPG